MSPRHFCCTICGWVVLADWDPNSSETWANQFRGLCTGPDGLRLTGVGLYDDPNEGILRAPIDRDMRWSDVGHHESADIEFGAMTQPAIEDRHGFIFHDACWNLLEKASHPVPVSFERLFEVCKSLPFTPDHLALSWGHDFGGAAIANNVHYFPWEDRHDTREFYKPHPVFSKDPYEASGVDRVLVEDPEQPPTLTRTTASPQEPIRDCFASLPQELCTAIAICLPTADVLRARLASKAFWPVFYSQQFWASRFKTSTDRSWFFEARECSLRDWRWLYRRTTDARISPGLQNRRRIWELLQGVLDALALSWNELPFDLPAMWSPDSVLRETNHRAEAIGDLWSDEHPRNFDQPKSLATGVDED
ncbi:hypothetical protein VTI28DRAFT_6560 [Corynascus sepedonium]